MDAAPADSRPAPLSHAEVRSIIVVMLAMPAALGQTIVAGAADDRPGAHNVIDLPGGHVLPGCGNRRDPALRQVQRHPRAARHHPGRYPPSWSAACLALAPSMLTLISGAPCGARRRGSSRRPDGNRRCHVAKRAGRYRAYFAAVFASSSLAGPVLCGVITVPALVGDLLDQPAAWRARLCDDQPYVEAAATARAVAPARRAWRSADHAAIVPGWR